MNLLRVPPAVDFAFEKAVNSVLEEAALDYDAVPEVRMELMEHLRERWRQAIENGGSTESAEQAALEAFGDPQAVGRSMRLPWWRRVLDYRRCRTERHLWFILSYIVSSAFLTAAGADESTPAFTLGFYMGSFLLVAYAVGSIALIRRKCPVPNQVVRALWSLRQIGWFFIASFALNLFVLPPLFVYEFRYELMDFDQPFWMAGLGIAALLIWGACWFSLVCFWKELRDALRGREKL